jgi:hypothetical protein
MICWAEITLPSSRVRSAAFRTNLLNNALLGRRVIGTVSGSGLIFLDFDRSGAAGCTLASGAEDTKTGAAGAGTDFAPTGWLAAAASRAARSLDSLFFFIGRLIKVARWCGVTIARLRNFATLSRHEGMALRRFAFAALQ